MVDPIPDPELSYQEAWRRGGAVETVWHEDGQDALCALAPHGGDIEACTDQIAVELYKNRSPETCSMWAFHGFGDDAFDTYHVTSTEITAEQFPKLSYVDDVGFEHCISFHVKSDAERIEVGGLADRAFRDDVADVIETAVRGNWDTVTDHEKGKYMATTSSNVVNRLTSDAESGVQIELPIYASRNYRKRIARELADFYR